MTTEELNSKSDSNMREDIRRTFYKRRIRKDNIKLELDDETPQEERRRLLLEHQKQHRQEAFNAARVLQETYFPEMDADEDEEEIEPMDVEQNPQKSKSTSAPRHRKLVMFSEWMIDMPEDLVENWIMVPCPQGKRNRLVAGKGITKAYRKTGVLCNTFYSALPGGNPNDRRSHTVLDCIWMNKQQVYYALDVLSWQVPLTNCEADCRQYWMDSKISETEELREHETEKNTYPILPLPRISCNSDLNKALADLAPELLPLDGLLFYHRKAHYYFGRTPLVTWLKPFMLPEVLGISVPSPLDEKPETYVNMEHYIKSLTKRENRSLRKLLNVDKYENAIIVSHPLM